MKKATPYPVSRYDRHFCLKIPPLLWLTMLFLMRHTVLVLLSFLPRTGDAMTYLRDLVDPLFLFADLPAGIVLFAAVRRKAGAQGWIRALWQRGGPLLASSALLYLLLLMAALAASERSLLLNINEAIILSVLLNLAIVAYLGRSPLLKDVFADFPVTPDD
jgi:hypothetical protein